MLWNEIITLHSTHHRHVFPNCNVARLLVHPLRCLADIAVSLVSELSIYDSIWDEQTLIKMRIGGNEVGKSQHCTRNNS